MTITSIKEQELLNQQSYKSSTYFPVLDGLRFVAYLLVLYHHICVRITLYKSDWGPVLNSIKSGIAIHGWCGVDLFFVISGFLITSILLHERRHTGDVSLSNFYMRRALRIFPVYYLYLAIAAFFTCSFWLHDPWNAFINLGSFATFTGNFLFMLAPLSVVSYFGPLWSLCIEEQFYLIHAFILKRLHNIKALPKLLITAYVLSVIIRFAIAPLSIWHFIYYANSFTHIDGLVCGTLAAVYYNTWMPILLQRRKLITSLQIMIPLLILLVCVATKNIAVVMTLVCPLWTILLCAYLAGGNRILEHPITVHLGQRTYVMYVFQVAAISLVDYILSLIYPQLRNNEGWLVFPISYIFAVAIWKFIEEPCNKLKQRITKPAY
jgi:peptidoglycan/LPS O-acetylase OafA/YrhL